MTLEQLHAADPAVALQAFLRCCGSTRWADRMTETRPFANLDAMIARADAVWSSLDRADWLEAFAAHPPIGSEAIVRDPGGHSWAAREQSDAAAATDAVRDRLAVRNREYLARFGYIFIVCATGKSADTMLRMLERRLAHDPDTELRVAADEQRQITQLRLAKLVEMAAA